MARPSRILGRKKGIANKEAARKSHNKSYRKMKETRPTQYQAKRESRKKARPAYIARVKSFVQHEKILNTVEVNNGRLFASLPDGTTKEIFDSVHKYKSGGKYDVQNMEGWAQGVVRRLQELELEGMDRVSAHNLFNLNKDWDHRHKYVRKFRAKYGYPAKENVIAAPMTELLANGRLFASLPDGTTKEIFDSVHKYKSGGKDKELSREVWAQGEVNRLQELGLEGMDRVSARSLFKLNAAWNKREVYVMKGRAKYGYPMHSV